MNEDIEPITVTNENVMPIMEAVAASLSDLPKPWEPQFQEIPSFLVPECCREGWDECSHVVRSQKVQSKRNVGL